jgi:hypothetical protein
MTEWSRLRSFFNYPNFKISAAGDGPLIPASYETWLEIIWKLFFLKVAVEKKKVAEQSKSNNFYIDSVIRTILKMFIYSYVKSLSN